MQKTMALGIQYLMFSLHKERISFMMSIRTHPNVTPAIKQKIDIFPPLI